MGLLNRWITNAIRFASKDVPAESPLALRAPAWQTAGPTLTPRDYRSLLDEGYRRNVIVYVCIQERANALAGLPLLALDANDRELIRTHPMAQLLRRPNPNQGRFQFIEATMTNLLASGNAYVHKVRSKAGMVVQLWNLRPDRVKVVTGSYGPRGYEYTLPGERPQSVDLEDVIHLRLYDPLDDFYGMSPLAAAAREIDLDAKGIDYLRSFFLNGAAPSGILTFKEPVEASERERIRRLWKQLYGGQRGWHELAVLDSSATYKEIGSRPQELKMDGIWGTTESRICAALGVPPIVVQVKIGLEHSTFANYHEAVKAMWSETIVPDSTRIADGFSNGLETEFAGQPRAFFDLSGVEVLQEAMQQKREDATKGWEAGIITRNEARDMWGLDPVEDEEGNEFKKAPAPFAKPDDAEPDDEKGEPDDEKGEPDDETGEDLALELSEEQAAKLRRALR